MAAMPSMPPMNEPAVAIALRRPKQAPFVRSGAKSPTRASRGVDCMPLPKRSKSLAIITIGTVANKANMGLDIVTIAKPIIIIFLGRLK